MPSSPYSWSKRGLIRANRCAAEASSAAQALSSGVGGGAEACSGTSDAPETDGSGASARVTVSQPRRTSKDACTEAVYGIAPDVVKVSRVAIPTTRHGPGSPFRGPRGRGRVVVQACCTDRRAAWSRWACSRWSPARIPTIPPRRLYGARRRRNHDGRVHDVYLELVDDRRPTHGRSRDGF